MYFDEISDGLENTEQELENADNDAIQYLIESSGFSVNLTKRLIRQYGKTNIEKAFLLDGQFDYAIDFLLRKYKGAFYRNTYPFIVVDGSAT